MERLGLASTHYERVVFGLIGLFLVLAGGTGGYMLIEGWSFLDALYMSSITVTTVGYREVQPLSREGELFTIVLLFFGVGAAFYILTTMVAAIIEGDLRQVFGARRMRMSIERLSDHYIVCGYGRVGEEIAREMTARRVPFIVVDTNEPRLQEARDAGILVIQGDATSEQVLDDAGIRRCRALIAASDSDSVNTYITLTARGLQPGVFIVARVSSPAVEPKLRQAGANRVISPYLIGGRRMALAAMQPIITDFIDLVPDHQAERVLAEVSVDEASGLAGKTISEALAGCDDVVALAVRDSQGRLNVGPPRNTELTSGDILVVIGSEADLRSIGAVARH
jgi:voltage-gated potassium channel